MRTLEDKAPATAVIVGAGYIGLEMADALTTRGLQVIQMEQLPEVLPTVDPALGWHVHEQLATRGVEVLTGTTVRQITRAAEGEGGRLRVDAEAADGTPVSRLADMVLVVVGVRPDTDLAADAGAALGVRGAIAVDRGMRTNLPDVYAAGDCVVTYHRLLGETYLPLGTTAHKQGRVAGENALGGHPGVRGEPGHPGREDLRPGRRPHRAARPRSCRRRVRPGHRPVRSRRPQGLLPRQPPHHDAVHRRPRHRAAPGRAAVRAPARRDRQTRSTSRPPPSSTP